MNDWTYYANIARDEETRRNNDLRDRAAEAEQRLKAGRQRVNDEFDGAFTPGFYQGYANDIMAHWRPEIDQQYRDAQKEATFNFARTQPGGGSASAGAFGRLKEAYDKSLLAAGDNARRQAAELRKSNEGQHGALLIQLAAGADPGTVVPQVEGAINNVTRTPTYSPIGDLLQSHVAIRRGPRRPCQRWSGMGFWRAAARQCR